MSYLTNRRLEVDSRAVRHTHDVLILLSRFSNELTRVETNERGYVATGDLAFIDGIDTWRANVWDAYFRLEKITSGDSAQQSRVDQIRQLTQRKLAFVNLLIDLRRHGHVDKSEELLRNKEGKVLMDAIQGLLAFCVDVETKRRQVRIRQAERVNERSSVFILASLLVSSSIGFITLILYRRLSKERERSIQGLREFSSLLEGVFESSQSGIMVFKALRNSAGRIEDLEWVAVNNRGADLVGRRVDEMLGRRLLIVSPANGENGVFETYRAAIETGRPVEIEQLFPMPDGRRMWLIISAVPITNGLTITFSDITARKKDALRLESNEANLQALINNTADEVWSVDRDLNVITANQAFSARTKPKATTEFWTRTLYRSLNGERFIKEITVPDGHGEERLMDYRFNPVFGADGRVTGVAVFGQDITEKRSVEARIRQQSQLLNTIVENIPIVIFSVAKDGRMLQSEGKGLEVLGFNDGQAAGWNMLRLYPHHRADFLRAIDGEPVHFIWQSADEQAEWYFDTYLFPDESGKGAAIGIALDISPTKASEYALQEAKKRAESASAFKTRFLANMSHEIRTPLSAILGFADILRKEDKDIRHQEFLSHIESAGTTLLKLIGDILDLTKIEEGKMVLAVESFPLQEVVSSMLHPYKYTAQERGLSFELTFSENLPAYLIGDAGKLVQVLVNLVGNALKFTKEGGVAVVVEGFEVSDEAFCLLQVSVIDSGIGVAVDMQTAVFDAFSQADDSIRREFGGSGLGLSIAREMVRILGGRLELESPSQHPFASGGPGTRFYFTLPFQIDAAEHDDGPIQTMPAETRFLGRYRVLMVEDNPVNQRLAMLILTGAGCEVMLASNGQEGVDICLEEEFDLVLMDVQMPVLDGLSATRAICELKPGTQIVGLSANVYKEDIDACYAAGMVDFLAKPYTTEKLLALITRHKPGSANLSEKPNEASVAQPVNKMGGSGPSLFFLRNLVGNDTAQMREFVVAFQKVATEFVHTVDSALASPNGADSLAMAAHKLKASVHMVGLDSLFPELESIEQLLRRGDVEDGKSYAVTVSQQLVWGLHELDGLMHGLM